MKAPTDIDYVELLYCIIEYIYDLVDRAKKARYRSRPKLLRLFKPVIIILGIFNEIFEDIRTLLDNTKHDLYMYWFYNKRAIVTTTSFLIYLIAGLMTSYYYYKVPEIRECLLIESDIEAIPIALLGSLGVSVILIIVQTIIYDTTSYLYRKISKYIKTKYKYSKIAYNRKIYEWRR